METNRRKEVGPSMVMGTQIQHAFSHMQNVDQIHKTNAKGGQWERKICGRSKKTGYRASECELRKVSHETL